MKYMLQVVTKQNYCSFKVVLGAVAVKNESNCCKWSHV